MYEKTYGAKYDSKLSTVQIAALVRGEIKAAVKAGTLPKGKYSVRSDRFSGGSSIDISVTGLPFATRTTRDPEVRVIDAWDPRASELLATLKAMLAAYNHDGSDIQSDYFDVKFYGSVDIDPTYEDADPVVLARCQEASALAAEERASASSAPVPSCVAATGW